MPLRKVNELTFLWFRLPGPLLINIIFGLKGDLRIIFGISAAAHVSAEISRSHYNNVEARERHINRNFSVRLRLGRLRMCPWDKPSLSLGQTQHFYLFNTVEVQLSQGPTQFVPGTSPESKGGGQSLCVKSLCAFFARH